MGVRAWHDSVPPLTKYVKEDPHFRLVSACNVGTA
jgi:hypothetical protein